MEAAATETEGEEEEEEAGLDGRALDVMVGLRYGAMLAGDVNGGRELEMCLSLNISSGNRFKSPFTLEPLVPTYGKYRSRDHRSATVLYHVFTTVYDIWGG